MTLLKVAVPALDQVGLDAFQSGGVHVSQAGDLLLTIGHKALQFLIDSKISTFISSLSYEIYLWQYPVLFVLGILYPEGPWYIPLLGILLVLILSLWLHRFTGSLFSGRKKSRSTSARPAAQA